MRVFKIEIEERIEEWDTIDSGSRK